tara:strand:+ start:114 stop:413 length:300 start_codon:yes stop_codon:yes gene_type:complete
MLKAKIANITKLDISKKINSKIGFSSLYTKEITEDFIEILKKIIKNNGVNIKNFGSFKIIYKKDRVGRNPKTKKNYKIESRKVLSFIISKKISSKINYF